MHRSNLVFVFLAMAMLLLAPALLKSQFPAEFNRERLEAELESRNITIEELEERLTEEGISMEDLQAAQFSIAEQNRIRSIIDDLSAEKDTLPKPENILIQEKPMRPDSLKKENATDTLSKKPRSTIYGHELFRQGLIGVVDASNLVKAPESYILGQGDKIVISVWGRSQFESSHTIGEDGFIRILDGRIRIFLKGLSLGKARDKVSRVLASEYSFSEGEFDLNVNYSRTVRISIVGEVYENPGSYTLSGFNTVINALSLVKGPGPIGSLRNIKLQKSDGTTVDIDIYEFMRNPDSARQYYLEDNDLIIVPVVDKLISVKGAVRRPMTYELKGDEGIKALIGFAGGFSEKAYLGKIQLVRYSNNVQRIIDIDWEEYVREGKDFQLENGDQVIVESIDLKYRNYVSISGELEQPGRYERTDGMKISDIVNKAGLTPNSSTELVYLQRRNLDGTTRMIRLDLQSILDNGRTTENLLLQDRDSIEVWSLERFADEARIAVSGAVRYEGAYPYGRDGNMTLKDAITMAGGLRRDASRFATIHYNDPLNDKIKYYNSVDELQEVMQAPDHPDNFKLKAFDSIVVQSLNEIGEKFFVRIDGAVNKPGEFQYGENMTIKDLLIMAGGFQISAATNNIEISRVIIENNQPTKIVVANLEMNRDLEVIDGGNTDGEYNLMPYDNVAVRFIKDFDLQDRVFVTGEVQVPGPYALNIDGYRISSLIERAGGMTNEAFPEGATLVRNEESLGAIVIKLDEIMDDPASEFNLILKDGDLINVPKIREFVTVRGATRVREVVLDKNVSSNNLIRVPYFKGRDALYYINEFCGGFDDLADKQKVFVEYPNGEIKHTKPGFFGRRYPEVKRGSVITVGYQPVEDTESEEGPPTDWTKVLTDSVGQALSILTLILLVQRID